MLVRLIIIAAILFGGMHFYQQYQKDKTLNELSQPVYSSNSVAKSQATSAPATEPTFACDGRQHCSQMNSLEEAKFLKEDAYIKKIICKKCLKKWCNIYLKTR